MKKARVPLAVGVLLALAVPADVDAQQVESVTVEASRVAADTVGFSASGIPVKAVSLAYKVRISDIDLAAPDASVRLEKRVREAALAACRDLGRTYPVAEPNDAACAREATEKAMGQVEGILAAAGQSKP